jgi:hypothetical protein
MSARNHNLLAIPKGIEVSPVGLKITARLSYEQWEDMVGGLQRIHRSILWLIGDALCYGEQRWGEKYSQAIEATGYAVQTLMNAKWVSSRVEFSYRKENLSWTHHLQVAALEPDEQRRFLQEAVDHDWGVQELRAAVRLFKEPEPKIDWQEVRDPPDVSVDGEEYEEVGEQIFQPARPNLEADFRHLLQLCKAYLTAEQGDLARGIKPNEENAIRLRTALEVFISEHD